MAKEFKNNRYVAPEPKPAKKTKVTPKQEEEAVKPPVEESKKEKKDVD